MSEEKQKLQEKEFLLKQLSQRQEDINNQVLQALQQAMSALLLAQQQLLSDIAFQKRLRDAEDANRLLNESEFDASEEKAGEVPTWLLSKPPELQ
ncbi:MAG: hypothetical protein GX922_06600 [Firmicutes bacterium]|nr:hypothetical protein [Bacillota bacterium]